MKKLYEIEGAVNGKKIEAVTYQIGNELVTIGERTRVDEVS